jgi:integrase
MRSCIAPTLIEQAQLSGGGLSRLKGVPDSGQRRIDAGAVRATRLRHVAPAASALAAQLCRGKPNEGDRIETIDEICGHANDNSGLAIIIHAGDRHDARADALLCFIGQRF